MSDNGAECNLHSWRSSNPARACPECSKVQAERDRLSAENASLKAENAELRGHLKIGQTQLQEVRGKLEVAREALEWYAFNYSDKKASKALGEIGE